MRIKLLVLLGAFAFTQVGHYSWANDWGMVGKDPQHTGSIDAGPQPPLRKSWFSRGEDPEGSLTTWPILLNGSVIARSGPGILSARSESGARNWWRKSAEGSVQVAPSSDDARIFISIPFGFMVGIESSTLQELWRFSAGSTIDGSSVLDSGILYFGAPEAKTFYALDALTGALKWEAQTELEPSYVPAVADGVVVIPTESLDEDKSLVLAFDAETGQQLWEFQTRNEGGSPSILGDKVIVAGGDFNLYALDLETGAEVWQSKVEAKFGPRNMPALAKGDVFLVDRIGNMYRFDGETGRRKWFISTDETEGTFDQSSPVIAGKTLFIGSGSGDLYAVDIDSGKIVWNDAVKGIVLSGAADSERFYFGVKFGEEGLYAFEHDPMGELISDEPEPEPFADLIYGLLLLALIIGGVLLVVRIRKPRNR